MNKLICMMFLASPIYSLLSPLNQSIREIKAILSHSQMQMLPQSEEIEEILKKKEGYLILTPNYEMQVSVKYKKSKKIGPKSFELHFKQPLHN